MEKFKTHSFDHHQTLTNKKILNFRNIIIGTVSILFVLLSVVRGIYLYNPTKTSAKTIGSNTNEISQLSTIFLMQQSGNDYLLFTMNPDGSKLNLLFKKHFNNCEDLQFSLDGKWLTYYDDKTEEIVVMKSGENQVKIIPMEFGSSPAISPDGQKLVFALVDENFRYNIYSMNLLSDSQDTKKLLFSSSSTALISDIKFTTDGNFIVFKVSENKSNNLCLIDAKSGKFIKTITTKEYFNISSYVISSSAATIYFITSESFFQKNNQKGAVYKLKIDGSEELEVLHEIKMERLINLAISPDDKYLLFAAQYYDSKSNVAGDLFLKKLEIENLKDGEGYEVMGVPLLWT